MQTLAISTRPTPTRTSIESRFEELKPMMKELYMKQGKTRQEVSRIMREQHGLIASKYQYEKAFGTWNWKKNVSSHFWDSVCLTVFHLKKDGEVLEGFHNGTKIEDERIRCEMRRRPASFFRRQRAPSTLPAGLVFLFRNDQTSNLFFQLPFHFFVASLETTDESFWRTRQNTRTVYYPGEVKHSSPDTYQGCQVGVTEDQSASTSIIWPPDSTRIRVFDSVVLPILSSIQLSKPLRTILSAKADMTTHHWQICLSIANNFAGLTGINVKEFFRFLRNEMSESLRLMVRQASTSYTMQSLICNIMKASVGMGDAETVHAILNYKHDAINANNLVCTVDGFKCTALEKASSLSHKDVVRVLLHHQADTWMNGLQQDSYEHRNVVDFLIAFYDPKFCYNGDETPDPEILSLLIQASGQITCSSLRYFIKNKDRDRVQSLIEAHRVIDEGNFFQEKIFHAALSHLDESLCLKLLTYLNDEDSDINCPLQYLDGPIVPMSTLIDLAAKRGFISAVENLIQKGASPNFSTLVDAMTSRNEKLVTLLLKNGTKFEKEHDGSRSHLKYLRLRYRDYIVATESLIAQKDKNSVDYTEGDVAKNMIIPGVKAYATEDKCHALSLWNALENHDASLIRLLLEEGVNPNCAEIKMFRMTSKHSFAIELAVSWGNRTVIRDLISAGVHVHYNARRGGEESETKALTIAVRNSDKELVTLLLQCPPSPSPNQWRFAIQAATENNDVDMVELLITFGACQVVRAGIPHNLTHCRNLGQYWGSGQDRPMLHHLIFGDCHYDDNSFNNKLQREDLARAEMFDVPDPRRSRVNSLFSAFIPSNHSESGTDYHNDLFGEAAQKLVIHNFCSHVSRSRQPLGHEQLDCIHCKSEIFDILLDTCKKQHPIFYQKEIICNMARLIWLNAYDSFTNFVEKRLCSDSFSTFSEHFRRMYSDAIARARCGNLGFVRKLLEHGCSPQALIHEEDSARPCWTAFLGAITTGRVDLVKLFIEHKADVNFPPRLNVKRTPLQEAAAYGYLDIVHLLIKHGANINAPAARFGGATALQLAAIGGYNAIIDLLVTYGGDVDAPAAQRDGRTALEGAAEHGRLDTVKVLLNAGGARGGKDRAGIESAIKYADENGHPYISDMLKEYLTHVEARDEVPCGDQEPFEELFDWNKWAKDGRS